jgi:hypothetical protein
MKSIARKTCLWAAALAVAVAAALTVGPEFGLAGAKPNLPCSNSSHCAGAAGTGGTNAKGSRLVTTVAGPTTINTVTLTPAVTTFGITIVGLSTGVTTITLSSAVVTEVTSTGPPTTITQEGSANGGRTVVQTGTQAPSTVHGHH